MLLFLYVCCRYRRLALQWHPMKNADKDAPIVTARFAALSEAYDVLTNAQYRAIYDIHGQRGLKAGGIKTETGDVTQPYTFNTDPSLLFDSVFGTLSPYAAFFAYEGKEQQTAAKTGEQVSSMSPSALKNDKVDKSPAQELNLYVSLEEVYRGCVKKVKVTRKVLLATDTDTDNRDRQTYHTHTSTPLSTHLLISSSFIFYLFSLLFCVALSFSFFFCCCL